MTGKNNELSSNARLEVFNGVLAGRVFQLGDEVVVGRQDEKTSFSASPDISLPDGRVSRRHARIFTKDGHYYLEDLNSTNGTFLNGCNVAQREPVMILKGNNVQVGETHMRFYPAFREKMADGDNPVSSPWQSEIGLNEQAFDFSNPANSSDDK
ncbi:MAG: FHA domain-containing protein [Gammaproteobacteria bacterium]|nr:FHA domain-containing protein [Gammaproteobacteria bacterium]